MFKTFQLARQPFAFGFNFLVKLEFFAKNWLDLWRCPHLFQEWYDLEQFSVTLSLKPRQDRYTVVQLKSKRLGRVVDDQGLIKIAPQNSQILQIVAFDVCAIISEDTVVDCFMQGVKDVKKLVCVNPLRG